MLKLVLLAVAPLEVRGCVPRTALPSDRVTEPVGAPELDDPLTSTAKVTVWPEAAGLGSEVMAVEVG